MGEEHQGRATLDRFADAVRGRLLEAGRTPDQLERLTASHDGPRLAAQLLVEHGLTVGASDIHVTVTRASALVTQRRAGVVERLGELERAEGVALVDAFKQLAGMTLDPGTRSLKSAAFVDVVDDVAVLRVTTFPGLQGECVAVRLASSAATTLGLQDLPWPDDLKTAMTAQLRLPHGLVVSAGPTGSGKSTVVYAFLQEAIREGRRVMTIEDPVAYFIEGAIQAQTSEDFSAVEALQAIHDSDADVAMVHEINTPEIAALTLEVARTGHLVLSTMHALDAIGALQEIVRLSGQASDVAAEAVQVICCQRLVRKSCPSCRVLRVPDPDEAVRLGIAGLDPLPELVTNTGCDACSGHGAVGRMPVVEMLTETPALTAVLRRGGDAAAMRAALGPSFRTMDDDNRAALLDHRVSIEEALRWLSPSYEVSRAVEAMVEAVTVDRPDVGVAALDGTVTIMFSDIVESTALTSRVGDAAWIEVLRHHHALVRKQVEAWGGVEVKSVGDGFMLAFASARSAVRCGLAIHEAVESVILPDGSPVQVRVGLHAGEPVRDEDDFYGTTVNMAARVASAAAPGEVLVSDLVRNLLATSGDFAIGPARNADLKGIAGAQALFPVTLGAPRTAGPG